MWKRGGQAVLAKASGGVQEEAIWQESGILVPRLHLGWMGRQASWETSGYRFLRLQEGAPSGRTTLGVRTGSPNYHRALGRLRVEVRRRKAGSGNAASNQLTALAPGGGAQQRQTHEGQQH